MLDLEVDEVPRLSAEEMHAMKLFAYDVGACLSAAEDAYRHDEIDDLSFDDRPGFLDVRKAIVALTFMNEMDERMRPKFAPIRERLTQALRKRGFEI